MYAYVYILARASFLYQPQNLIDLGKNLGFSKFKTLYSIILLVARPAIVAVLSLVVMALNINKISIFELLIILSGLAIVLIWQGKDVTFGQRFLIGQLPIASFIFVKYYKNNKFINKSRRSKFKSLLIDKDFEPENPKQLEELDENSCKWPIGHPDENDFYFCGRTSLKDFSYCKLHLLYAFQPKNKKEEIVDKDSEVPKFIQKKIKSA